VTALWVVGHLPGGGQHSIWKPLRRSYLSKKKQDTIMQIGSFQSTPNFTSTIRPEGTERGPDRDNDGDEGGSAKALTSAATSASLSSSGRGQKVNMLA
jgi:hypothetical protein